MENDAATPPDSPAPRRQRQRHGETRRHQLLKEAAYFWAQKENWRCAALEVSLPNCRYRADVAAYKPGCKRVEVEDAHLKTTRLARQTVIGKSIVFECKQARADFLKDSRRTAETRAELKELHARRATLERALKVHYPSLRRGETLFPEYDVADLDALEHKGLRQVLNRISTLQNHLYDQTKFEKLLRYRCASLFYLVTPASLIEPHEAPAGWGLLEVDLDTLQALDETPASDDNQEESPSGADSRFDSVIRQTIRPQLQQDCPEGHRLELLQRIATASMRATNQNLGIRFESIQRARRRAVSGEG
jgi:hypothetical protein